MQTKTALNTLGRAINICQSAFSQARSPQRGVVQRQGRAPGGAAGQSAVAARADIPTGAEPANGTSAAMVQHCAGQQPRLKSGRSKPAARAEQGRRLQARGGSEQRGHPAHGAVQPQRCIQRVQGRHMCDWCPPCSPIMIGRRQSPVQCGDWTGHSAVQYPRMARWRSGWGGSCGLNQSGSSAGLKQNHCGYGQLSGRNNLWGERGRATVTRQPSRLDHGPGSSQGYDGS